MVALLLQRWLNYRGLLSAARRTEGETKNRTTELFFFQYQRQNKNYQSDDSVKHTVSSKVTQRFFASDEVVTWKAWKLARICFHSSLSGSDRALSLLDSFSSSYLFECPSRVFVWMLESINIVEQIDEDNHFLTVEICRGS